MRTFRLVLPAVVLAISLGALAGCSTTSQIAGGTWRLLTGQPSHPAPAGVASKRTSNLAMKMQLSPVPVRLPDTRQIEVLIRLENISSRFVQLEFPTSQRIEILVQDQTGKQILRWSEDHSFEPVSAYVGINPGEHVEYAESISTRDMQPGQKYTVTAFFPSFEKLKAEEVIVPQS